MVNDLLNLGTTFSNSARTFLSTVKDETYFVFLDLLIRVETSPNQKRKLICLMNQTVYFFPL